MYPIISGTGEDRHYEAFGVRLVTDKDIPAVLKCLGKESLLFNNVMPLLKKALEENETERIFNSTSIFGTTDIEAWLSSTLPSCSAVCGYSAIASKITLSRIYDELLKIAPLYFDRGEQMQTLIYPSCLLSSYLEVFKEIGFTLVRSTKKKEIIGETLILPSWRGNDNEILTANTMALMLLTGQTSFIDDGEERSIILWGKPWEKVTWENKTKPYAHHNSYACTYKLIKKN